MSEVFQIENFFPFHAPLHPPFLVGQLFPPHVGSTQTKYLFHYLPLQLLLGKWQGPTQVLASNIPSDPNSVAATITDILLCIYRRCALECRLLNPGLHLSVLEDAVRWHTLPCEFSPSCPPAPRTFHTARKTVSQCLLKTMERCPWIDFILTLADFGS